MISEVAFATRASSFWRTLCPTSESFVRLINTELCLKYGPLVTSGANPNRRGLINETAFEVFVRRHSSESVFPRMGQPIKNDELEAAYVAARQGIVKAEGESQSDLDPPSPEEKAEVLALLKNLEYRFFEELNARSLSFRPFFQGCGIISSCYGDICTRDSIFEVKAGERPFRSTDLRQIVIYCTLLMNSQGTTFSKIELVNPRLGIHFSCSFATLCFEISGKRPSDLMFEITEVISSSGVSI